MATPVIMPKQGQSVETCIITSWLKKKGEVVHKGDILFSYETDKAAFDLESAVDGILLDVFFDDGAEVPVLVNVAVIGSKGEETELYRPGKPQDRVASKDREDIEKVSPVSTIEIQNIHSEESGKTRISPRAKRLAEDKGLN